MFQCGLTFLRGELHFIASAVFDLFLHFVNFLLKVARGAQPAQKGTSQLVFVVLAVYFLSGLV